MSPRPFKSNIVTKLTAPTYNILYLVYLMHPRVEPLFAREPKQHVVALRHGSHLKQYPHQSITRYKLFWNHINRNVRSSARPRRILPRECMRRRSHALPRATSSIHYTSYTCLCTTSYPSHRLGKADV